MSFYSRYKGKKIERSLSARSDFPNPARITLKDVQIAPLILITAYNQRLLRRFNFDPA